MRDYGRVGRRHILGAVVTTCAVFALCGPAQAWAAGRITVCPTGCDYSTLQDAINAASPGDTIDIGAGTYENFVSPSQASFTIDKSLRLIGSGASQTTIGGGIGSVIQVTQGVFATVKDVTIGENFLADTGVTNDGTLALTNTTVTSNFLHDGVDNAGTLLLRGTTITDNLGTTGGGLVNDGTTVMDGGAITANDGLFDGGGIVNSGNLIVNGSSIAGNDGHLGDDTSIGGGLVNSGSAFIDDTQITGNTSAQGGGIFSTGNLTLLGSTVTDNLAQLEGSPAPAQGGGVLYSSHLTLLFSRVSCNNPQDLENQNGTGRLTEFASIVGHCPATATAATANGRAATRSGLARLDRALLAAAATALPSSARSDGTIAKTLRSRVQSIRAEAARIRKILASR
jgi:predicted outer membrane repeat protein